MTTLVDALMAVYHMTLKQAFFEFPLTAAVALWPSMQRRLGFETSGPDYMDQASARAKRQMEDYISKHFRVIPNP